MEQVKEISEKFDIPEWKVKEALGFPLVECQAISTRETSIEFYLAKDNSEEKRSALLRWEELLTNEIKNTINLRKLLNIYNSIPGAHISPMQIIVYRRLIEVCKTAKEASEVYGLFIDDIDLKKDIYTKWVKLFLTELENSSTLSDLRLLYPFVPKCEEFYLYGSELEKTIIMKFISFFKDSSDFSHNFEIFYGIEESEGKKVYIDDWDLTTIVESKEATSVLAARCIYEHATEYSEAKRIARDKWNSLSLEEVNKASNIEEALSALNGTLACSEVKLLALMKVINFCETLFQIKNAYSLAIGSDIMEKAAINKIKQLLDQGVEV